MSIKILVVEDETIVALDIKSALKKLKYEVTDCVTNCEDALKSIHNNPPTIILMDIQLENSIDGIETAKLIKKINDIPIIYLTANSEDSTIARAIQTNPIGYLVKPFNRDELKSTIMLASYKLSNDDEQIQEDSLFKLSSNYYYDTDPHLKIFFKNQEIKLTQKERMFMDILIQANGEIVPFNTIEHYLWSDKAVSDSTLRTLIYRLRSKLDYKVIETLPTYGCKIIKD